MPKKYFTPRKRKNEISLMRIVAVIVVVLGLVGVGIHYGMRAWSGKPEPVETEQAPVPPVPPEASTPAVPAASTPTPEAAPAVPPVAETTPLTPEVREALQQADTARAAGNLEQAVSLLDAARQKFASSPEAPVVTARYARALEDSGKTAEAVALYEELRSSAPPGMRAEALLGLGRNAERAGDLLAARQLYDEAFRDAPYNTPVWNDAVDAMGKTKVALIFAPMETPDSKVYELQKGDSLTSIGIKLNTTQGLLMRANNLTEQTTLQLGQRLKYTPKDFRILIERSSCRLFLLDNDGLFKRYYVGLGMPGYETTLGKYTIGNKEKDPIWHKKGSAPVPSGDPTNELGTRWMPLVPTAEGLPKDLGIHGTIAPETIGQYKSHGCPRMKKEDVEELYDLIVRSTPVEIVDVLDPARLLSPVRQST